MRIAVRLWVVNLVFGAIAGAGLFVFANPFTAAAQRVQPSTQLRPGHGLSAQQSDAIFTIGVIAGAVLAAVSLAVEILFLVKMRRGRNWARITLTVFAGLGVVGTLLGLINPVWAFSYVSAPVTVALYVGAVVFMYRPAATAYFTGPRPR